MAPVGEVGVSLRCQPHGELRPEPCRRHDELGCRRHSGPGCALDALQREPPALPVFRHDENETKGILYQKAITHPTQSIWNCNPKNVIQLTAAQEAEINAL